MKLKQNSYFRTKEQLERQWDKNIPYEPFDSSKIWRSVHTNCSFSLSFSTCADDFVELFSDWLIQCCQLVWPIVGRVVLWSFFLRPNFWCFHFKHRFQRANNNTWNRLFVNYFIMNCKIILILIKKSSLSIVSITNQIQNKKRKFQSKIFLIFKISNL